MPLTDIAVNEAVNEFGILTLARPDTHLNKHLADGAKTKFCAEDFQAAASYQNLQANKDYNTLASVHPGKRLGTKVQDTSSKYNV